MRIPIRCGDQELYLILDPATSEGQLGWQLEHAIHRGAVRFEPVPSLPAPRLVPPSARLRSERGDADEFESHYVGPAAGEKDEDESKVKPCDFEYVLITCSHMGGKERTICDVQFWRSNGTDMNNLQQPKGKRAFTRELEIVARHDEAHGDKIKIKLDGGPGYTCNREHPFIRVKDQAGHKYESKGKPELEFTAVCKTLPVAPVIMNPASLIASVFFPMQAVNLYTVDVESCGRLADGSYGFGRTQQKIRAYPSDTYTLSVSLPAPFKRSYEQARQRITGGKNQGTVTDSFKSSTQVGSSKVTESTKIVTDAKGAEKLVHESTNANTTGGVTVKTTQKMGAQDDFDRATRNLRPVSQETEVKSADALDTKGYQTAGSISLARNGAEMSGSASLGTILQTILKIQDTIEGIANFIKNFQPQVGWKFVFEFSFLKGSISYSWGYKEWTDHSVYRWWKLEIGMTLFALSMELSFGADISALGCTFTVKVFGKVSCDFKVKAAKEASPDDPKPWEFGLAGGLKGELGVRAALGCDWVSLEGKMTVGLTYSGKIKVGPDDPFHIDNTITYDGIKAPVTGAVKWVGSFSKTWTVSEARKEPLYKGTLFGKGHSEGAKAAHP